MDCFMIGNGFDLHYGLPTAYTSFIQTIDFLCKKSDAGEAIDSVAQLFASEELRESDFAIKKCYELYGDKYDANIEKDIPRIIELAKNNFWFSYLNESQRLHPKWIDFEKEIATVLSTLSRCFDKTEVNNGKAKLMISNKADIFILKRLKCIGNRDKANLFQRIAINPDGVMHFYVDDNYVSCEPEGSDNYVVNWKKISDDLFASLRELAEILSIYLECFVSRPLESLIKNNLVQRDYQLSLYENGLTGGALGRISVVSFNYTQTWEKLYPDSISHGHRPAYVHGELCQEKNRGIV